jgi:hydroxymethylbilane synthase
MIEHGPSRIAVDAERGFLSELGGDCDLPAAAHASVDDSGEVRVDALLAALDGHVVLRHTASGSGDSDAVGRAAARHLLDEAGGRALLDV